MKKEAFYSKFKNSNIDEHELKRKYDSYIRELENQKMLYEAARQAQSAPATAPAGGGGLIEAGGGDLTLVFSSFAIVDALLPGGFDSLPDWNAAIVLEGSSGSPYTSISVDEPNFTVYLSGGSNIKLKENAFNGVFEVGNGLGQDLISIIDTGEIVDSGGTAFYGCQVLETVILPAIEELLSSDFTGCLKLRNVQLPSVIQVGTYAFYGAFNDADSPITLNLPLCTAYGASTFLESDGEGGYFGTTEVDLPKVMNATFSTAVIANSQITLLLAENSGILPTYV